MKVNSLQLINYRNYKNISLNFHPEINLFLGENAQGKTNLLESLYVLALTKSHRTSKESEMIRFEAETSKICGIVEKRNKKLPLEISLTCEGRQTKVNHLTQRRLADYIGKLTVILFSPEDLAIIKGNPGKRRRFLDMEISQISPIYLYDLLQYQTILKQRNTYLKKIIDKKNTKKVPDMLYYDILSEQLVNFGSKIIHSRLNFVENLSTWVKSIHNNISNRTEQLSLNYSSSFPLPPKKTVENIQETYLQYLKSKQEYEFFKGTCSYGPHRDDLKFFINDIEVATFGSQGQQRTCALSLKLAEIDLIHEQTKEYPILLLDDVMSELDNKRQLLLLQTIYRKTQTFITTTSLNHLEKLSMQGKQFTIVEGKIQE
jgi:DNA replication and repair protein RecF